MAETLNYAGAGGAGGTSLVKVGGVLAIAGTIIGAAIFMMGCFGFSAAFTLSIIPLILGTVGIVLTFVGGIFQKPIGVEDTHVLAALILNVAVIAGSLLEIAIWFNKPIFASGGGM
jgi:hypothetical protein